LKELIKWGKLMELEVYEDSQAVYNGLEKQYQSGILEAKAPLLILHLWQVKTATITLMEVK
jgi:hypothetical protein